MHLELDRRDVIREALTVIKERIRAQPINYAPTEYARKACTYINGEQDEVPFFSISRKKKDGQTMTIQLNTAPLAIELLYGVCRAWIELKCNTCKIYSVLHHCELILQNFDRV